MEFFCYHRDRPGSMPLRTQLMEQHWSYVDRFAATMIARGPTFALEGSLTGSVHILGLPDVVAAHAFAFDEPGHQAGTYRDVLLRRWQGHSAHTMWDSTGVEPARDRYLVIGFTSQPAAQASSLSPHDRLIVSGNLLSDDGSTRLGVAALLEATDADDARSVLPSDRYAGVEVHRWRFGGRPS